MKRYILFFVAITLFFTSCKWDEEPQYSPAISNSYIIAFRADSLHTRDTLQFHLINDEYVLDTIAVNDTVLYYVGLDAVTNQLTSFVVTTDTALLSLKLLINSEFQQALEATSDPDNGRLDFKAGYRAAALPIRYIAKKSGSAKTMMKLSSTSKYSPSEVAFFQPIR